jgi:hypothetical protein
MLREDPISVTPKALRSNEDSALARFPARAGKSSLMLQLEKTGCDWTLVNAGVVPE